MPLSSQKSPNSQLTNRATLCSEARQCHKVLASPQQLREECGKAVKEEIQTVQQEETALSDDGSGCSERPVPPPGLQLPHPLARDLFTTLQNTLLEHY